MPLNEEERAELLSRQIADKVTATVEGSLRRRYSWIGLITAFVLGGVGYGLISAVVRDANRSVTKSEVLLELAEDRIDQVEALSKEKLAEIDALATTSRDRLQTLESDIKATQERVEARTRAVEELLSARQQDLENLGRTADQIAQLWARVGDMNEQLAALAQAEAPAGEGTPREAAPETAGLSGTLRAQTAEIQDNAVETETIRRRIETSRITVFVQVGAGLSREQAEAVSAALSQAGYAVPGVEWVRGTPGQQQVRYFHSEDRQAAERLAAGAEAALQAVGAADTAVEVADLTSWPKAKPRQGTLELWLGRYG